MSAPVAETFRVPVLLLVPYKEQSDVHEFTTFLRDGLEEEGYPPHAQAHPLRGAMDRGWVVSWTQPARVQMWLTCVTTAELLPVIRRALQDAPLAAERVLVGPEINDYIRREREEQDGEK
jgi:hypothetical protein